MLAHEKAHWWYRGRRELLRHVLARRVGRVPRLLEIGCGTGSNLAMLSEFGAVEGLETSDFARAVAAERGYPVHAGQLPTGLPQDIGPFDAICMFDVLEHIEADAAALAAVRCLLRQGGRLVLSVPAYQWLFGAHDVRLQHFRRYSRAQLTAMVRRAGFALDWSSYFNTLLFPPAALVRLAERAGARLASDASGAAHELPRSNALLYQIFGAEKHLTNLVPLPFGLSIVCVATRKGD